MTGERVVIALVSALAALPGVLAYLGVYRSWAPPDRRKLEGARWDTRRSWPVFTAWFFGGFAVQFTVYAARTWVRGIDVLAFAGLAMLVVAMLLIYRVPWRLHPRWYRRDRAALEGHRVGAVGDVPPPEAQRGGRCLS